MKKTTCLLLALVLAAGLVLGAGAVEPMLPPEQVDPEPWIRLDDSLDPAGAASNPGAIRYADVQLPEAEGQLTVPAIGIGGSEGNYLNDGGKYPIHAMVSFMDDDGRSGTYDRLFLEVIEPLELPYTLSLPLQKLGREGYIDEDELRLMLDAGVSISCHAMNENAMTDYDVWELDGQLLQWKELAGELGCGEVLSYAYCNGLWSEELLTAVKAHFRMGFTVDGGINQMPYESYFMKRVGLFSHKTQTLTPALRDGLFLNAGGSLTNGTPGHRQTTANIPVREGEEYLLTCSAVWRGCCYAIYDGSGRVLEKYNAPNNAQGKLLIDHKVRIPAGAAYMRVSHNLRTYGTSALTVRKYPDSATLHGAKAYVDQVAREGGWLVFMTHAWYPSFSPEDLTQLVEYIRQKDIPIVDVNDAIRLTGNVVEVGTFRKPLDQAVAPYFVVSADGRVYTNALQYSPVPENYESVRLQLSHGRLIYNDRQIHVDDPGYVVSVPVDVSGCEAVLVTGWAYDYDPDSDRGYQIYTIADAEGRILGRHTAAVTYADGGEKLDHQYVELPEGAAFITVAGNLYHVYPELTLIHSSG